ncbi:MAG: sigma-70 family RNA polymerase sigma factor [Planctomycetota bacterium]|nr:sigma-70 family RNA polymerase sigma factor [Planctomycetota bacterium]
MDEQRIISLVTLAQTGNRDAFGELAVAFESSVFSVALRRLRNRAEAHEVTQDVLIQAMRKLDQLREPERFAGWLKRIAVRMSINRAVRRPNETQCAPETFGSLKSEPQNPLENLLKCEAATQVRGGMDRLREMDRETLIAFYFKGHSLKQMSVDFDSPIGTIKRRLHTARSRLRQELESLQSSA